MTPDDDTRPVTRTTTDACPFTSATTPIAADWPLPREGATLRPPQPLLDFLADGAPRRVRLWDGSWAWLLTRYDDARDVLRDRRFTAVTSAPGFPMMTRISAVVRAQPNSASFIRMDDPDHARLRGMLTREFLARSVEALRPAVRAWLDDALAPVAASPFPIDLVPVVTDPLPSATIAMLLGVPAGDTEFFQERGAVLIDHRTTSAQAVTARDELDALLRGIIERRRDEPAGRDDLISRLVDDHVRPGALSVDEAVPMCRLLLLAGHATTANQGSLSVLSLLGDDVLRARLRDDPAVLPAAVDELLRLHSIVQNGLARAALEDVEVGGALIAAGEGVIVSLSAGNRDAEVYPDPDTLDVTRRGTGRHLAFGHGPHQCLGMWLARLELEELLAAVLRHLPDAELAVPRETLRYRTTATNFGVMSLPVRRPSHRDVPALPDPQAVAERTEWLAAALTGDGEASTAGHVIEGFDARWPGGFAGALDGWRAAGPFTVTGTDILCHKAMLRLAGPDGERHTATLTCDTSGLVRLVQVSADTGAARVASLDDLDGLASFLDRAGVDGSAAVGRIAPDGTVTPLWEHRGDVLRPLGSVSKLYPLVAAADAVGAKRVTWDEPLTLQPALRSLPTGDTQHLPTATVLPLSTAAVKMIALSDNTAHDLLVDRLGADAVEAVLADLGHSDPAANAPFLTTRQLFTLGWSRRVTREQWRTASGRDERLALARQAAAEPFTTTVADMRAPAHDAGLDWYATPRDLLRLWGAVLERAATDEVVAAAIGANPGTAAARDHWHTAAFKGGSTPGALSFCWAVRQASGEGFVLVLNQVAADPEVLRDPQPTLQVADRLLADVLPALLPGAGA